MYIRRKLGGREMGGQEVGKEERFVNCAARVGHVQLGFWLRETSKENYHYNK
jgi:hypothetical protein